MIMGLACSLYMATSMIDVEEGFVSGCGLDSLVFKQSGKSSDLEEEFQIWCVFHLRGLVYSQYFKY